MDNIKKSILSHAKLHVSISTSCKQSHQNYRVLELPTDVTFPRSGFGEVVSTIAFIIRNLTSAIL